MSLSLSDSISVLPGVGPTRETQLALLGITSIQDLLYHVPFRYEEVEPLCKICQVQIDQKACVFANVVSKTPVKLKFKRMVKVRIADASGAIDLTWFNMDYVLSALLVGESYYFRGKVSWFNKKPTLTNPTFQAQAPPFGSLLPVYHESSRINSKYLGKLITTVLSQIDLADTVDQQKYCKKYNLLDLKTALTTLHLPVTVPNDQLETQMKQAKQRLAFDEMLALISEIFRRKKEQQAVTSPVALQTTNSDIQSFYALLPYAPTPSQKESIQAIALDFVQPHPMYRLLQGEVGSGKTTVAAFALWVAAKQGQQAILVCPTNILASQHFQTLTRLFEKSSSPISIGLYTGKEKNTDAQILVGTHALFNLVTKDFHPTVVVVDEEHRFGVNQRETFLSQIQKPHYLSMTATPIPRTVALTALADRDVSFIVPHTSKSNIKTWAVPSIKRRSSYPWITQILKATKGQALIVCPFISESIVETLSSVKSATKEFEQLQEMFPTFELRLLHGKRKSEEKDAIFAEFMEGKADVLVTTPVVEVGVDLPKANVIVIEGAERFGLAQLHQLRGRVGRRGQDSYCLLFTSPPSELGDALFPLDRAKQEERTQKRLEFFASTYDGNALAEYDLRHRGSGELLGAAQHGFGSLRFANWFDTDLIKICKMEAQEKLDQVK